MKTTSLFRIRAIDTKGPTDTYVSLPGGWSTAYDVANDLSNRMKTQDPSWTMLGIDYLGPLVLMEIMDVRSIKVELAERRNSVKRSSRQA